MAGPPTNIRALNEPSVLEIHWNDGSIERVPYKFLRGECPCAACVDEITGVRTLDVDAIPDDVRPLKLGFSGNYALKISWSDGHETGLFTWAHLARLAQDERVSTIRPNES